MFLMLNTFRREIITDSGGHLFVVNFMAGTKA